MKSIKEQIDTIQADASLPENHLRLADSHSVQSILTEVQKTFCDGKANPDSEPGAWLWEGFCSPCEEWDVRGLDMVALFELLLPPEEKFWFMVLDKSKGSPPFWLYRADLEGISTVIWHSTINEYYIVDPAKQWLLAENHEGKMFALGEEAIARLKHAKTFVL